MWTEVENGKNIEWFPFKLKQISIRLKLYQLTWTWTWTKNGEINFAISSLFLWGIKQTESLRKKNIESNNENSSLVSVV